jgi:hypothetical protein
VAHVIIFRGDDVMAGDEEVGAQGGAHRNAGPRGHGARAPPPPAPERESTKTRAMISLLKDGMKPLDVNASDMTNHIWIFREAVERYFTAIGIDDLDDEESEADRVLAVKSAMGPNAAVALIGRDPEDVDTYEKIIDVLTDQFAPSDDDVHTLGLLRQCTMRDDETYNEGVRESGACYRLSHDVDDERVEDQAYPVRATHVA